MKLAHLALWTQDLEAAAAFWQSYFDAEIGDRYDSCNRPGVASRFVQVPGIAARIEIIEGPWVTPPLGETSGWAHIALSVGSKCQVDTFADRFRRDGLLVSEPCKTGDGYYEAIVRSTEGTLIEIVE